MAGPTRRRAVVAAGVALALLGVAGAFAPSLVAGFALTLHALTVVGLGALVAAVLAYRRTGRREAPEADDRLDVEVGWRERSPGAAFDRAFERARRTTASRSTVRSRLRTVAAAAISSAEGVADEAARERLAAGTWTSDPHAAAFFADDPDGPPRDLRTRGLLGRTSVFEVRATHALDEVERIAGVGAEANGETADADGPAGDDAGDGGEGSDRRGTGDGGPEEGTGVSDETPESTRTGRWRAALVLAFVAVGLAALLRSPAVLLVAGLAVAVAGYADALDAPDPALVVERDLSQTDPDPGERVEVTVTVTNEGGFLPDLRVVDGVPPALDVVDGSARAGTALRAGRRLTFSYAVAATRGSHEFAPARAAVRNLPGSAERVRRVGPPTRLECVPPLAPAGPLTLRRQTLRRVGRVTTDEPGSGLEFHTVREYLPGDPLSRVDWARLARTGDLATVQFREERAARVVLVLDARESAYHTDADDVPAFEHAVSAAGSVGAGLLDAGDQVGLAAYGPTWTWLAPGSGRDHRFRLADRLALDDAFPPVAPEAAHSTMIAFRHLRRHLPGDAQVVFVSPILDVTSALAARRLESYGFPVTVLSPDVTGGGTAGRRVAALERRNRIRDLRGVGVPVLDWDPADPLALTLARAARWSR